MSLAPESRIGPYQIVAPIGSGGMGEVYRARDTRLNREVAVKVLPAALHEEPGRLARFELEARAAGSLNHPNILAIYDVGVHDGCSYLVSELLEGETLRQRLRSGAFSPRKAVEVLLQIAAGLAAAHRKGIIHRDLKPDNIFITADGHVKILDFGLAKAVAAGSGLRSSSEAETESMGTFDSAAGALKGTPGYMSPEQIRGQPADARSDIFGLGAVFYEMLSGQRAFRGSTSVEIMHAALRDDPAPIAGAPPALVRIALRCLEKRPEERFESVRDLAFALEAWQAEISSGRWTAPVAAGWRTRLRAPAVVFSGGVLIGTLLLASAWFLTVRRRPPPLPVIRYLTYSGRDWAPALSPDGKTIAFTSERDGTPRIWLKQISGDAEQPLTEGPDDLPRFSPDGSEILFIRKESKGSSLYRVPAIGGEPRRILYGVAGADFSPDGQQIAFVRWRLVDGQESSAVGIAGRDGSERRSIATLQGQRLEWPRWSPDGQRIALTGSAPGGYRDTVWILSADGSQKHSLTTPGSSQNVSALVWSRRAPDTVLYLKDDNGAGDSARLIRHHWRTGRSESTYWPHSARLLDFGAGGLMVFDARSTRSGLRELRPGEPAPRWVTRGTSLDRQPVFAPGGDRILFTSNRGGNMDIWQVHRQTGAISRLTDHPASDIDPALSPQGRFLLWSSDRSGHFEVFLADSTGGSPRQVTQDGADAENPTMTRDGWIVYASAHPQKTGIWKIRPNGSEATRLVAGTAFNPEASPDGRHALYVAPASADENVIRVVRLADAAVEPFEIRVRIHRQTDWVMGRARWTHDGAGIVFIGQNERGVTGVFRQDFRPGADTGSTRRPLGGFDEDLGTETLAVAPDGDSLLISSWEQVRSVMMSRPARD